MADQRRRRQISNCSVAVLIALSPNWHEIIRVREIDMANNSSQSNGVMPFSVDLDNYDDADVVAFGTTMHKIGKVKAAIKQMSRSSGSLDTYLYNELTSSLGTSNWWIGPGTDCEILKVSGKDWKKGKVKLRIVV